MDVHLAEVRLAKHQNVVDLTPLQMTTGLRVKEALTATWENDVTVDDESMSVTVSVERSKTHRARTVPALGPEDVTHLQKRQSGVGYVIGSPADPTKIWDGTNARKAVAAFYKEMAEELDIPLLDTARTHVWRATLNTRLMDQVPEVVRAAHFGHTTDVNRSAYTDITDVSSMLEAAERRRRENS